jgi:hypothetical protein
MLAARLADVADVDRAHQPGFRMVEMWQWNIQEPGRSSLTRKRFVASTAT